MTTMTADHENENRSDAQADTTDSHGGRERPSYDDVNVPVVFLVGVISMILTFVTIWFVEGIFYQWKNGLVTERTYDVVNTIQTTQIENQKKVLTGDEEKGITSVDSAIDGIVDKYRKSPGSESSGGPARSEDGNTDGHSEGH